MGHVTTADARLRGLPGSDTYRASHIAYLNDHHRDWSAVRLNIEAMKAFTDTIQVSERDALADHRREVQEFLSRGGLEADLPFPWSPSAHDLMEYINYEHLKVASGFELHLKARLLARGFVLHILDNKIGQYKALADEQRNRPIQTQELLGVAGFHFDGKHNYLPGLTDFSLKFSWLTDRPLYRAVFGLEDRELDVIKDYRELRNQIHLPGDVIETPALHALGKPAIEFLLPFINREIVGWSNQLISAHGFNFRRLPELK